MAINMLHMKYYMQQIFYSPSLNADVRHSKTHQLVVKRLHLAKHELLHELCSIFIGKGECSVI